jgi:predicted DNA-binding transcriptional regulator AlpA
MRNDLRRKVAEQDRFLRMADLKDLFGVCDSTIYKWIKRYGFPSPYKPGPNTSLWDNGEINQWILNRR